MRAERLNICGSRRSAGWRCNCTDDPDLRVGNVHCPLVNGNEPDDRPTRTGHVQPPGGQVVRCRLRTRKRRCYSGTSPPPRQGQSASAKPKAGSDGDRPGPGRWDAEGWVAEDEVYGANPGLGADLERRQIGYVLAWPGPGRWATGARPAPSCA